ncbi:alpha-1a adrenergic receptor [Plakobranchus ocellatus]|uniref:Alpha-1a adrenergic receptor n=1 Tax=Plakobranchus ocellatus TaxID=259542 RepID=A0AAV4AGC5_9GAST|nr:alpha-1a adrenergic receptor [Plakobranchus ocellatus]
MTAPPHHTTISALCQNSSYHTRSDQALLEDLARTNFTRLVPTIVFLCVLGAVGTCGNSLSMYIFVVRMRRSFLNDLFILLSGTSLLTCALSIPGEIIDFYFIYIYSAETFCKMNSLNHHAITRQARPCSQLCAFDGGIGGTADSEPALPGIKFPAPPPALWYFNLVSTTSLVTTLCVLAVYRLRAARSSNSTPISLRTRLVFVTCILVFSFIFSLSGIRVYGIKTVELSPPYGDPDSGCTLIGRDCAIDDDVANTAWPIVFNIFMVAGFLTLTITTSVCYYKIWRLVVRSRLAVASYNTSTSAAVNPQSVALDPNSHTTVHPETAAIRDEAESSVDETTWEGSHYSIAREKGDDPDVFHIHSKEQIGAESRAVEKIKLTPVSDTENFTLNCAYTAHTVFIADAEVGESDDRNLDSKLTEMNNVIRVKTNEEEQHSCIENTDVSENVESSIWSTFAKQTDSTLVPTTQPTETTYLNSINGIYSTSNTSQGKTEQLPTTFVSSQCNGRTLNSEHTRLTNHDSFQALPPSDSLRNSDGAKKPQVPSRTFSDTSQVPAPSEMPQTTKTSSIHQTEQLLHSTNSADHTTTPADLFTTTHIQSSKKILHTDSNTSNNNTHNTITACVTRKLTKTSLETNISRTAMLLTVIFIVCYLPFFCVSIPTLFYPELAYSRSAVNLNVINMAYRFYFITPAINPIIFYASNADFRRKLKELLTVSRGLNH